MNAFQIISKKILNLDDFMNYDSNIIKSNENDCFYNKLVFYIFIQKIYSIPNKYLFLDETLKNIFINDKIKCDFINIFSIIQKIYWGFSKIGFLYKYKKAKIIIEYDLCLNPIKENEKNIFCLMQNNNKYLFNIHDLIKIIHNSIANTSYFFNNPLPIKNPYNNVLINKSSLYNIYFYIRMKTLLNPELLFNFFKTNFNINEFTENYQFIIREYAIYNYLMNSSSEKLYEDINQMIKNFNITSINIYNKISIDNDFPRDLLIKIMKPYLKLYFLSEYTLLNATSKLKYKKKLHKKLIELNKFNSIFGRKILKFTKIVNTSNSQYKTIITFNSDHPDFNDKKKEEVKKKQHIIFYAKEKIQTLLTEYDETQNKSLLEKAVRIQIEELLPATVELRQLRNEVNEIIESKNTSFSPIIYRLFQYPCNIEQLDHVTGEPPRVIKFSQI
jgi:hypothetical protein